MWRQKHHERRSDPWTLEQAVEPYLSIDLQESLGVTLDVFAVKLLCNFSCRLCSVAQETQRWYNDTRIWK